MINFANFTKPHVIPAVAERFCVKGERTHCVTGEKRAVRCLLEIQTGPHGIDALAIVEGGPTGHEGFYMTKRTLNIMGGHGWWACAGTKGRWDSLFIDAENMKAAAEWIKGKSDGAV